jgi:hypothetical protein
MGLQDASMSIKIASDPCFLIRSLRCFSGPRVRLCNCSRGAVCWCMGDPRADGRCPSGRIQTQTSVIPHSDTNDGLLSACGRSSASHPARVWLASGRPLVPQPWGRLPTWQLHVPLHSRSRVHCSKPDSSPSQLQRGYSHSSGVPGASSVRVQKCTQ